MRDRSFRSKVTDFGLVVAPASPVAIPECSVTFPRNDPAGPASDPVTAGLSFPIAEISGVPATGDIPPKEIGAEVRSRG